MTAELKPYWVRFKTNMGHFEYEGPWWTTGIVDDARDPKPDIVCAAVMAYSEDAAKAILRGTHDDGYEPNFDFVSRRNKNWSPFSDRFKRAEWMKWPQPYADKAEATG